MKTYQSPILWNPSDLEIIASLPEYIQDHDEAQSWLAAECEKRNAAIKKGSLGPDTGWPSKWIEEIEKEPMGEEWLKARIQAHAVTEANGILILHGKRGGGKTRMAADLALSAGRSRYRTAMRFFLEIRSTYGNKEASEIDIIDNLTSTPLLILDELQERGETAFEDRLLTHLIDARYAASKPTIIIANLTKNKLSESLGASIVDRVRENGKSIDFTWPSFRGA